MTLDPDAIEDFLTRPIRPWPEWKKLDFTECQQLIEARTGIAFKRSKGPRLYYHQLRALTACIMMDHTLVFMGMRTGKTRVMMEYMSHMRRSNMWRGQGIVIAPGPTVVKEAWELQAEEWCNLEFKGITSTNIDELVKATESDADVIVVGWPSLLRMFGNKQKVKRRGRAEVDNKYVLDPGIMGIFGEHFTLGCIDELHYCANPATARFAIGKALIGGANVKLSAGLTGTAFGRLDPFQVWAQANIIEGGHLFSNNYYFFRMAFGKKKGSPFTRMGYEIVFDKKKAPIFQKMLTSCSIAYKLSEVRKSDIRYEPTILQMKGEQLSAYNGILDRVIERSKDKELTRSAQENVYIKLRRISAGIVPFVDEEGKQDFFPLPGHAKERWLEEALSAGMFESPVILFHDFIETGKYLTAWLKKKKIKHSWLYGGTKTSANPVAEFRTGKVNTFVANIASGSVGIDLSRGDYLVFYEGNPSSILRAQAEARPLGPGRGSRPLIKMDLLASPVDKRVLKAAAEGVNMHDKLIYSAQRLDKMLRA